MPPPRRLTGKKLLVASLGVAAISYLGCEGKRPPEPPTSGNLMAPQPPESSQVQPGVPTGTDGPPTSGNLMPPKPLDAGPKQPLPADAGPAQPPDVSTAQPADAGPAPKPKLKPADAGTTTKFPVKI